MAEMQKKIDKLENTVKEEKTKRQGLEKDISDLKEQLQKKDKAMSDSDSFQNFNDSAQTTASSPTDPALLGAQVQEVIKGMAEMQKKIDKLENTVKEEKTKRQGLEKDISDLKEQLQKKDKGAQVKEVIKGMAEMQKKIDKLENTVKEEKTKRQGLEKDISDLKEQLQKKDKAMSDSDSFQNFNDSAQTTASSPTDPALLGAQVQEVIKGMAEMQKKIDKLENTVKEEKTKRQGLEKDISDLKEQLQKKDKGAQVKEVIKGMAEMQKKIDKLENTVKEEKTKRQGLEKDISDLKEQLQKKDKAMSDSDSFQNFNDSAQTTASSPTDPALLGAQVKEVIKSMAEMQKKIDKLENTVKEEKTKRQGLEKDISDLKEQLQKKDKEIEDLKRFKVNGKKNINTVYQKVFNKESKMKRYLSYKDEMKRLEDMLRDIPTDEESINEEDEEINDDEIFSEHNSSSEDDLDSDEDLYKSTDILSQNCYVGKDGTKWSKIKNRQNFRILRASG
ncbi:probable protein phosphatase DDB_G0282105 [Uloborus diversus]|uniref:probable protein phosphatase DDB_G0282105 n=1 Tax=Uloborus diversus TaxID=327109 RepID=UPI002409CFAA|nr:probable protein phosphatase DDB_G0282105 [Uloborus diversus]